ncbi:hypothetical protein AAFF_G00057780 [Aldrovandia affinis]|uniref:Uncharacterized protein n=1 Tax=Aldrovandia affinis TaxID=143900 RepID=A0AAD7S0Q0_9TELE|nr:hypothetical protein AAFF_G00057780 [Aldrovandia affinis]
MRWSWAPWPGWGEGVADARSPSRVTVTARHGTVFSWLYGRAADIPQLLLGARPLLRALSQQALDTGGETLPARKKRSKRDIPRQIQSQNGSFLEVDPSVWVTLKDFDGGRYGPPRVPSARQTQTADSPPGSSAMFSGKENMHSVNSIFLATPNMPSDVYGFSF